ncbi:hypothetical protein AMJ86_00825 [bacterium SM23_57]|nr:MAG: hypothetical protein AMJ86_00825 [bacterium SM23_57]
MPKNVTIEIVDVQTKESIENLQALSKEMDAVGESTQELDQELDKANETLEDTGTSTKETTKSMGALPGPVGRAQGAVQGLSAAFKALLANPVVLVITAIIGALALLFKAFTSTKEGGEKLQQFMAGFRAVMDVLRDVAVKVGETLVKIFKDPKEAIKNLWEFIKAQFINRLQGLIDTVRAVGKIIGSAFKLDWEGVKAGAKEFGAALVQVGTGFTPEQIKNGLKAIATEFKNIGREIAEEARMAAMLTAQLQDIRDLQRELNVLRAEQNRDLAQQRLVIEDINETYQNRLAAIDQVQAAEENLLARELEALRARLAAEEALAALSDSSAETLDQLAQLRAEIARKEEENAAVSIRLQRRRQAIMKEQDTLEQQFAKASEDRQIAMIENELERELAKLEQQKELDQMAIDQSKLTEETKAMQRLEIEEYYLWLADQTKKKFEADKTKTDKEEAEKRKKIAEEEAKAKDAIQKEGLATFIDIVGESSVAGKAAAIAQAIISTWQAAAKALTGAPPPWNFIGMATTIAAGLQQVRKIVSTKVPGRGEVGMPSTGAIGSSPVSFAETVASVPVSGPLTAIIDPNAPPMKAYVVSTEMSTQQELDRRIEAQASI